MNTVLVKEYKLKKIDIEEVLRYAKAENNEETLRLISECIGECKDILSPKVCLLESRVCVNESEVEFEFATVKSAALAKNLSGCKKAVIFAATIGIDIDRVISRYGKISPVKAVIISALGDERIEALCDEFNREIKGNLKPRYSPGYGDLDISFQKELFRVLEPSRKIGLTLNESMIMSPSKSVTAIVGICEDECLENEEKCENCNMKSCEFRRKK